MTGVYRVPVKPRPGFLGGERQERTEWHRIVVWGRLAEICNQYLRKGSKVYIEGRLQTRSWEGQDGQKRYTTEVVARDMQMLDGRDDVDSGGGGGNYSNSNYSNNNAQPATQSAPQGGGASGPDSEPPPYAADDDLPF